jgi:hypothetical protein
LGKRAQKTKGGLHVATPPMADQPTRPPGGTQSTTKVETLPSRVCDGAQKLERCRSRSATLVGHLEVELVHSRLPLDARSRLLEAHFDSNT